MLSSRQSNMVTQPAPKPEPCPTDPKVFMINESCEVGSPAQNDSVVAELKDEALKLSEQVQRLTTLLMNPCPVHKGGLRNVISVVAEDGDIHLGVRIFTPKSRPLTK